MRWLVFVCSRHAKHVIMSLKDGSTCSNYFYSSSMGLQRHRIVLPCHVVQWDVMGCYLIGEKNHWEYHCKSKSIKHRSGHSRMTEETKSEHRQTSDCKQFNLEWNSLNRFIRDRRWVRVKSWFPGTWQQVTFFYWAWEESMIINNQQLREDLLYTKSRSFDDGRWSDATLNCQHINRHKLL